VASAIAVSEVSWIALLAGLRPPQFGKLITVLRRQCADPARNRRPWSHPLEDRALLVGVSKSVAGLLVDHSGSALTLQ
jgi:hypothetical protein